jgi:hypothetical protein
MAGGRAQANGAITLEIEHHDEENAFHTRYKVHKYQKYKNDLGSAFQRRLREEGMSPAVIANQSPPKGYKMAENNVRNWYVHARNPEKKKRYPQLGSFEVTLRCPPNFARGFPDTILVWSKLNTRRWPDVDRLARDVVKLVADAKNGQDISDAIRRFQECTLPTPPTLPAEDKTLSNSNSLRPPRHSSRSGNPPMFFSLSPRQRVPTPVEVRGPDFNRDSMKALPPADMAVSDRFPMRPSSAASPSRQRPSSASRNRPHSAAAGGGGWDRDEDWSSQQNASDFLAQQDARKRDKGLAPVRTSWEDDDEWGDQAMKNLNDAMKHSEGFPPSPVQHSSSPLQSSSPPAGSPVAAVSSARHNQAASPASGKSATVAGISGRESPLPYDEGFEDDYAKDEFEHSLPTAAEEQRPADDRRRAAEDQRIADDRKRAEDQRLAEERRRAEEQRLADDRRRAAEDQRLADERKRAEEQRFAEEGRRAEEQRLAEERRSAEEQRLADERQRADEQRRLEEQQAEEKRLADRRAEEQRRAEERRAEEQRLEALRLKMEEAERKAAEMAKVRQAREYDEEDFEDDEEAFPEDDFEPESPVAASKPPLSKPADDVRSAGTRASTADNKDQGSDIDEDVYPDEQFEEDDTASQAGEPAPELVAPAEAGGIQYDYVEDNEFEDDSDASRDIQNDDDNESIKSEYD